MTVAKTYFRKREENRRTYKKLAGRLQVDYFLCRQRNLKEIGDCKMVTWKRVARHWIEVFWDDSDGEEEEETRVEQSFKWLWVEKKDCWEDFRVI